MSEPKSEYKVEVKNLTKYFGDLHVLNDISFNVRKGEFICIVGPTGCGKTTFLNLLTRIYMPSKGDLLIDGESADPKKHNLAFVFQEPSSIPWKTVEENLRFGLELKKLPKKEIDERVENIIKLMGLQNFRDAYPHQLSVSTEQRIIIGRAFAMNPDLLLMDEPLSNLDTELRVEMRREIKELHQKTKVTVVYVTHDQSEALALADRIVVMNQGQIEQVGTPQEIYSHPATPFVAKFVGRSNLIAGTWSADTFTPAGSTACWEGSQVAPVFRESGHYPVKPEHLQVKRDGRDGVRASVYEIEYQGVEVRMMLHNQADNEILEVRYRGDETYRVGDEVTLTL